MSTTKHSKPYCTKPSLPPFPSSPFTPPFDELFSFFHAIPLKNNPHVRPPPGSIPRNPPPPPFFVTINPPQFGSLPGPPLPKFDGTDPAAACLYTNIHEYFDFYATPHDERERLMDLCMEGKAAQWLQWMKIKTSKIRSQTPPAVASSSSPLPPWIELPVDVTANILQRVGAEEVLTSAQLVCTTWWKVSKDPVSWRVIDFSNPRQGIFNDEYNVMCRRAVDRSQGRLVDLTIQYFGNDALLDYIVHR